MKKRTTLLILAMIILLFAGCTSEPTPPTESTPSHSVPTPLQYPSYTFDGTPTTDELRETAVRAMRDLLTIQWTPAYDVSYFNTAGRDKQFDYRAGTPYGGLLYTGAGSGLFQFLEYYNNETGLLNYPGTGDELRKAIGSGCADSVLWSWGTVANSFSSGYYPSVMVQKNGYLPVGDYTYNEDITSYYLISTKDIIEKNTPAVMIDAYTKVLPADALISSSTDHAMMVIEPPVVVYNTDGTINTAESYILIQDQVGGRTSKEFYEVKDGNTTIYFNSNTAEKMVFDKLLKKEYIPITIADSPISKRHFLITLCSGRYRYSIYAICLTAGFSNQSL